MKRVVTVLALGAIAALLCAPVSASTVTIHYSGTLTYIDDPNGYTGFAAGQTFSGSVTYDLATAPAYSSATTATYYLYGLPTAVTVGAFTASSLISTITVNQGGGQSDFLPGFTDSVHTIGPSSFTQSNFNLMDFTDTALSSTGLVVPTLSAFSTRDFFLSGANSPGPNAWLVAGRVTSLSTTPAPTPEPTSLLLLGSGLLGLAGFTRNRLKASIVVVGSGICRRRAGLGLGLSGSLLLLTVLVPGRARADTTLVGYTGPMCCAYIVGNYYSELTTVAQPFTLNSAVNTTSLTVSALSEFYYSHSLPDPLTVELRAGLPGGASSKVWQTALAYNLDPMVRSYTVPVTLNLSAGDYYLFFTSTMGGRWEVFDDMIGTGHSVGDYGTVNLGVTFTNPSVIYHASNHLYFNLNGTAVPAGEPASLLLLGSGLAGLAGWAGKRTHARTRKTSGVRQASRVRRGFYSALGFCVVLTFAAIPLCADTVAIGTLNVTTTAFTPPYQGYNMSASITNLTSVTLYEQFWFEVQNANGDTLGPFEGPLAIPAGATRTSFTCSGGCNQWSFTLVGALASPDFKTSAGNFHASSLTWTSPQFVGNYNGSLPITIEADRVPEPGSLLLLGSGLAGLAGLGRKRLRG